MLPNLQNLSLFFFTLQTQRKNTASTSHTKSAAAAVAWSAFCHRLIWFFNSLFLSFFHYESVFDMLFHLICVSESPITVCMFWFFLLSFWILDSWTVCVGAVALNFWYLLLNLTWVLSLYLTMSVCGPVGVNGL